MQQPDVQTASPIDDVFARLKRAGAMAFMPFITAGDPDLSATVRTLDELAGRGADLIEIGFPYSDPIADGPVIQASYTRALNRKIQVQAIFNALESWTRNRVRALPPVVAMVSYALVLRMGPVLFLERAAKAGLSGLIVPDLPADEAADLSSRAAGKGLDLIQLIAPTTTRERTQRILDVARGFLYCISVAGTTGVRDQLPVELREQLAWLRTQTSLPLAVGFGISRPEQVDELRSLADGVIVGSALVRQLAAAAEGRQSLDEGIRRIGEFTEGMVTATRRGASAAQSNPPG